MGTDHRNLKSGQFREDTVRLTIFLVDMLHIQYVFIFRTSCGCIRVGGYNPLFFYDTDIGIDSNINYLDLLNIWIREPFSACVCSANIYMYNRYDEVKFNAGFYATISLYLYLEASKIISYQKRMDEIDYKRSNIDKPHLSTRYCSKSRGTTSSHPPHHVPNLRLYRQI